MTTKCYNKLVLDNMKEVYKSLTVLFKDSYDDAYDSYGKLVDEPSWLAHQEYSQALSEVGSAIYNLEMAGKML